MVVTRFVLSVGTLVFSFAILPAAGCRGSAKCPVPPLPTRVVQEQAEGKETAQEVRVIRTQEPATKEQVEWFRKMAGSMLRVQALLRWHTRTRGERSVLEATYAGREGVFSRKALASLEAYIENLSNGPDSEERLAIKYLRDFLARTYIDRRVARLTDEFHNRISSVKVAIPPSKEPLSFGGISWAMASEKDPGIREKIQKARSRVVAETLNPILMKLIGKKHDLAQWMGFDSYFALSERMRRVDTKKLLAMGHDFMQATEERYEALMRRTARESLGRDFSEMKRSDHLRLMRAPGTERFLPRELMVPAFKHFLEGIGLNLSTAAGTSVTIDDLPHPRKNPRAACFRIEVPNDLRISVIPEDGVVGWTTLFHEGGHALHFSWTTEDRFEFKYLGDSTATEAFAELFARVWAEPEWLERYRRFVVSYNKRPDEHNRILQALRERPFFRTAERMGMVFSPERRKRRRIPLMSRNDMQYLIRHRMAWEMYLYRRYGWAKLIYESVLHGGEDSVWKDVYTGDISDRKALYRDLFSKAYGYDLDEADAEDYLFDVDPFLYSVEYARAFIGADALIEHIREKFGANWFENKDVGPYLKKLWAGGTRNTAECIVKQLGYDRLDYTFAESRLKRIWRAAGMSDDKKAEGKKAARTSKPVRPRKPSKKPSCPGGESPEPSGACPIPIAE